VQTAPELLIDQFRPEDQPAFATLNRWWLIEYGIHEAADEVQLVDPVGEIIAPGGQIYVARRGADVVGTCAVVPHEEGVMEIAKLVVAPAAQGVGLGRRLVEACVAYARARGTRRLVLLSNSGLSAALNLYEKLGFRRGPVPPDNPYATADVYMELDL
jgi:ribosomal protein S18 acetylase RimI-like enzyme